MAVRVSSDELHSRERSVQIRIFDDQRSAFWNILFRQSISAEVANLGLTFATNGKMFGLADGDMVGQAVLVVHHFVHTGGATELSGKNHSCPIHG